MHPSVPTKGVKVAVDDGLGKGIVLLGYPN